MADEHPLKPFYSVLVLAFVCSALVAGAAVGLRPMQEANRITDQKKHILYAAGLYDSTKSIEEMFSPIETKVVELATGKFISKDVIDPATFKQAKAAMTEKYGQSLATNEDIAKIRRLEKYSVVYLVVKDGTTEQIILPVRGKGLWSTMYAYVALDADMTSIRGVSFYEHGETPGLGGEIENKTWQEGWENKLIYSGDGEVALGFAKGKSSKTGEAARYEIDGLSGATLTTKGVDSLMEFWFGDHGFKPFITNMKKEHSNG
ncbi:Na(+)-translocating NADH-quinone reductase subunit C [Desulforhopalus sp. IMCC35007]|uniref:Na(+)-translocating NADH-quinone reductase subunit C n=1 Tax=Desulforhopalus sp. IMCC35007 TaxID=2569543 RepID=UPI0010AEE535|nr:Na(+)-translocating NADH-quinone reductase subunit C [Desulforhopalus sp. IMCC35007]TKB08649.1 Na(+)-translocating NADH-quinone reductase subunit C [Desulforhopalus sp. IMCC35007]